MGSPAQLTLAFVVDAVVDGMVAAVADIASRNVGL